MFGIMISKINSTMIDMRKNSNNNSNTQCDRAQACHRPNLVWFTLYTVWYAVIMNWDKFRCQMFAAIYFSFHSRLANFASFQSTIRWTIVETILNRSLSKYPIERVRYTKQTIISNIELSISPLFGHLQQIFYKKKWFFIMILNTFALSWPYKEEIHWKEMALNLLHSVLQSLY